MRATLVVALAFTPLIACADDAPSNTVAFELDRVLTAPLTAEAYWEFPFPSDLRLTAEGRPDLTGFPNPRNLPIVRDLLLAATDPVGFSVMPTAWFRFTDGAPDHAIDDVIVADPDASALLVDIDPDSDERGTLYPLVAQSLGRDAFTGDGLVAVAPVRGIALRGDTRYAFVLRRAFAPGVEAPAAFTTLASGRGAAPAAALYAPLWPVLDDLGVARSDVLVATVFTTGDEVAVMRARSEAVRAQFRATIGALEIDPTDGASHPDICELVGTVTVPQFQVGEAPFGTEGRFELDAAGVPIVQGMMTVPLRITIPRQTMPAAGWPLWQYFHGSGGLSADLVDAGPSPTSEAEPTIGEGPGVVVGRRGIAAAAAALPVNPERLPGASDYAYLNLNNLAALPSTFQQGVFEQRLLLDALLELEIAPSTVAACAGTALPAGATAHRFDATTLTAGGHSMGGMYTNMIGAVEPRYGALTPFGAGGFWNMMILDTEIIVGARSLLAGVLGIEGDGLTFVHPALGLLASGWEVAEPGASMARIARRPLPGFTPRHVYQPIGMDDKYFPNPVFDAAALAYGNRQAGELVWPGTQRALAVDHLEDLIPYPVRANRTTSSVPTTSVVVQYLDGGIVDAHQIYRQLPAVRYQYGCFLASYVRDGVPTVAAPDVETASCP